MSEESSLFCGLVEPVVEFVICDLAVAVFIESGESLFKGGFVESLVASDFTVELSCNFVDFVLFEIARLVFVEGGEEFLDNFLEFCSSD